MRVNGLADLQNLPEPVTFTMEMYDHQHKQASCSSPYIEALLLLMEPLLLALNNSVNCLEFINLTGARNKSCMWILG